MHIIMHIGIDAIIEEKEEERFALLEATNKIGIGVFISYLTPEKRLINFSLGKSSYIYKKTLSIKKLIFVTSMLLI